MKVLFVTRKYPPQKGGMENYSYNLIKYFPDKKKTIILNKPQIHLIWFFPYALIRSLLVAPNVDIIHVGDAALSLSAYLLKNLTKKPVIITLYGLDLTYRNQMYQWYLSMFLKADSFICISRYTEEIAKKRGLTNTIVIPPGIAIEEKKGALPAMQLPNRPILLSVGRLTKRKGIAWFIQNVMPYIKGNPLLIIAGNGSERETLEQIIKKKNLENKVLLLGKVDNATRDSLYKKASIFIAPNIPIKGDVEGFGIVLLEAAAYGLPVVAADLEGLKDAIINNKNGYLIKSKDAKSFIEKIDYLLSHAKEAGTFGKEAKEYTQNNYHWSKIIQKYVNEYKKVIQKKDHNKGPILTLSFDDCPRETITSVLPILQKYQFTATFNVIASLIGKEFEKMILLSPADLKLLYRSDMEIASHSLTHADLSSLKGQTKKYIWSLFKTPGKRRYLAKLIPETVRYIEKHFFKNGKDTISPENEIIQSKKALEDLGISVTSYSYPGGVYDKKLEYLVRNNYSSARTVDAGFNTPSTNKYRLKTFMWTNKTTVDEANKWVGKAIKNKWWIIETFHLVDEKNKNNYEYFTSIKNFEKHLQYIKSQNIRVITQQRAVELFSQSK